MRVHHATCIERLSDNLHQDLWRMVSEGHACLCTVHATKIKLESIPSENQTTMQRQDKVLKLCKNINL